MVLSDEALHAIVGEAGSRMKIREHLSASGLFRVVRSGFEKIVDTRAAELVEISLADTLMSAYAGISHLKNWIRKPNQGWTSDNRVPLVIVCYVECGM